MTEVKKEKEQKQNPGTARARIPSLVTREKPFPQRSLALSTRVPCPHYIPAHFFIPLFAISPGPPILLPASSNSAHEP